MIYCEGLYDLSLVYNLLSLQVREELSMILAQIAPKISTHKQYIVQHTHFQQHYHHM
jgi:hypothetical protein